MLTVCNFWQKCCTTQSLNDWKWWKQSVATSFSLILTCIVVLFLFVAVVVLCARTLLFVLNHLHIRSLISHQPRYINSCSKKNKTKKPGCAHVPLSLVKNRAMHLWRYYLKERREAKRKEWERERETRRDEGKERSPGKSWRRRGREKWTMWRN